MTIFKTECQKPQEVAENRSGTGTYIDPMDVSEFDEIFESVFDSAQKPGILLVDDDQGILDALSIVLKRHYNVVTCTTGQESVEAVDSSTSVVVLDIKMKGMDGFETIRQIKERFIHLPVIFHSAYQDVKSPLEIMNQYRPFAYIAKEGNYTYLMDTIRSAVEFYEHIRLNQQLIARLATINKELERKVLSRTVELEDANRQLRLLAITDELTGLYNRRYFRDEFKKAILEANEKKTPLTVVIMDIDHFKRINDSLGHSCGDMVLKITAECLTIKTRARDLVARYGGEEFVLLLPDTDLDTGHKLVEEIRLALENSAPRWQGNPVYYTASFGITLYEEYEKGGASNGKKKIPEQQVDTILHMADLALYDSKDAGRNQITVKLDIDTPVS